jgi:aconitate hydratase
VLPLQFKPGESRNSLGLDGSEVYDITGITDGLAPGIELPVRARRANGTEITFNVVARIDSPIEVEYYRQGGILPMVLRKLVESA